MNTDQTQFSSPQQNVSPPSSPGGPASAQGFGGRGVSKGTVAIAILALVILLGGFLGYWYWRGMSADLAAAQKLASERQLNYQVLDFTKFFVDKVLNAKEEVGFDDRLRLETMVRDLKNDAVFAQWQNFLNSASEDEAQQQVKRLLQVLIENVR